MKSVDVLRNSVINQILEITDKSYLTALSKLLQKSQSGTGKAKLTHEQILMLKMGEKDLRDGNIISQAELDRSDLEWLKSL